MRPNFDSIALPVAKWLRDEARRAELRREEDVIQARLDILSIRSEIEQNQDRLDSAIERLTRLESTEERAPLER